MTLWTSTYLIILFALAVLGFVFWRGSLKHWFWRGVVAVLAGTTLASLVYDCCNASPNFPLIDDLIYSRLGIRGVFSSVCFGIAVIVGLLVYAALSAWFPSPRKLHPETLCRKCGYILRGISEPRCPECGEGI